MGLAESLQQPVSCPSKFIPSAEDVKLLREETCEGMMTCKRKLIVKAIEKEIGDLVFVETNLKDVLRGILFLAQQ